jgi:5S rRNA maturation endonuclease (ribonuclease M5)
MVTKMKGTKISPRERREWSIINKEVPPLSGVITINGRKVSVDVRAELERFRWIRPRWTNDKLIAASPFRFDGTPSFFVNLDPESKFYGCWADMGATDPEWASGSLPKLLAFLDNVTIAEACEYLLANNASEGDADTDESYTLDIPELTLPERRLPLDPTILDEYRYRHPYLERRGISEAVQRLLGVGYDKRSRAVTMPWFNPDGTLANVKYRRVDSKIFWYAKNGYPIRELLYGINVIYERNIKRAAIVEAEIDAMTLMSAGVPAIATGGSGNFNEVKRDLIARSPLEEIVIVADHDDAGQAMKRRIVEMLRGYVIVKVAGYPKRYKDVNEYAVKSTEANIGRIIGRARVVRILYNKLL